MLKHGGPKLFRRARPFFLGLILGQFSIAGLWLIIEFLRALRIMWVFGSEKGVHMPDWALRFALGCYLVWAAPVAAAPYAAAPSAATPCCCCPLWISLAWYTPRLLPKKILGLLSILPLLGKTTAAKAAISLHSALFWGKCC